MNTKIQFPNHSALVISFRIKKSATREICIVCLFVCFFVFALVFVLFSCCFFSVRSFVCLPLGR